MTTPVRRQYLQIKAQYPDAVLFFRLGDFYETFDEDARVVSEVCDIALTSRPVGKNQRVPLAGVPYHAADSYIARLVTSGHKVAIAEQVGGGVSSHLRSEMSRGAGSKKQNGNSRGIVHREVVRVVTPGTVVEPSILNDRRNNYLVAVLLDKGTAGLAYADISTGEFAATQIKDRDPIARVMEELTRLQPVEILTPKVGSDMLNPEAVMPGITQTPYDEWHFEFEASRQALLDHFEVMTLDGFGLGPSPMATRCAGAIVQYLAETQMAALSHMTKVVSYSTGSFMALDSATRRNLELTQTIRGGTTKGSLLGVLDLTVTPMGARLLRKRLQQPLFDRDTINQRLNAVQDLVTNGPTRARLRQQLKGKSDLERLSNRVIQSIIRPPELLALANSLQAIPELIDTLAQLQDETVNSGSDQESLLQQARSQLDPCPEIVELIMQAIADSPPNLPSTPGVIKKGFSAELDQVLDAAHDSKLWVASLEQSERERTGIRNLKVGFNKVFGYYIEISKSNLDNVPIEYIRKQTLVNAERFITPELKEYESLILNAEERQSEIENRVYREVCDQVSVAADRFLTNAHAMSALDVSSTLAEVAVRNDYVRPTLSTGVEIEILAGRHPVVEHALDDGLGQRFVPNDIRLSDDELILVITGPNMSGKSTYLRQIALITLMAQIGSFVPAEQAKVGLVDRIFTRIGAEDIIHAGQSTFMVEMVETANILNHATPKSLLVLDEIGRGTSTYDGLSIAWAVVEYIHNHPNLHARTLFATHYHELTELAELLPNVHNYNVAVAEEGDQVAFLHRIVPGGADRSYGIHVAQLAGLPRAVIHRAQEILQQLEDQSTRTPGSSAISTSHQEPVAIGQQLSLFSSEPHPVVEAIHNLDINSLTPLEAISKLYELQKHIDSAD